MFWANWHIEWMEKKRRSDELLRRRDVHNKKMWGLYSGHYRHPKTTQERRETQIRGNLLEIDEYRVHVRANRNFRNLPNSWDDLHNQTYKSVIYSNDHYSWKHLRKNQYK